MLKIFTIILGLSVFHLCLVMTYSYLTGSVGQEKERPNFPFNTGPAIIRKVRFLTVDAAIGLSYGVKKQLLLFTGNHVQIIVDGQFSEEMPRQNFHLPDGMHLQAAYVTPESQDKIIFYGEEHGKFVSLSDDTKNRMLKYGPARAFIRDGGPDAAGRRAGKVYVFKACEVAVRNDWNDWGKPVNVTTIGLPCDIDAAWNEEGDMVILKDEKIWRWNADGTVNGPDLFSTFYNLKIGDMLKPQGLYVKTLPPQPTMDYSDSYALITPHP